MSTANPKSIPNRNYHLDALRGFAALVVVFDHLHQLFSVPLADARGPIRIFYLEHYFGGAAVMLFFSLSGYLVGTSVVKSVKSGKWSWSNYLTNRLVRLYVALIPALFLALGFDALDRVLKFHQFVLFNSVDRWQDFLGCFAFLQDLYVIPFGTDGPLWSLSFEFWYYLLFPLMVLGLLRSKRRWANLVVFAAVLLMVALPAVRVSSTIAELFPCWLIGVVFGLLKDRIPDLSVRGGLLMTFAGIALVCAAVVVQGLHIMPINYYYSDSIGAIPLLWAGIKSPKPTWKPYMWTAVFFSEMSYTVYLVHLPFLNFLKTAWRHGKVWPADATHLLMLAIPLAATLIYAYCIYLLFESRTDQVRSFVKARLFAGSKASQQPG